MSDLINRLRGQYRIPITDGLGAAGGEEPDNENEFVRSFPSPPIQIEAAERIEELEAALDDAEVKAQISSGGNMWRFWSDQARLMASRNAELMAKLKESSDG